MVFGYIAMKKVKCVFILCKINTFCYLQWSWYSICNSC